MGAGRTVTARIPAYRGAYDIVVPVGPSGLALLGDVGEFASLGRQRIPLLRDDGRAVHATVSFAAGERQVVLTGYAAAALAVTATYGAARIRYHARTRAFGVTVSPGPDGRTATVVIARRQ